MKHTILYLFGISLLIVNSTEKKTFDPDTKYFIYNKVTSNCIKRKLTNNGYTDYYIMTYGECTNDEDSLWYIRDNHIISAATDDCFAIVNSNRLGAKDCDEYIIEAQFVQEFYFEDDTICTKLGNCLKDRNGYTGDKKNKDKFYEWTISTSLPE